LRGVKPILSPRGMLSSFTIKGRFKPHFHRFLGKYLLKNTYLHTTSAQEARECLILIPDWSYTNLPNLLDTPLMDFLPQKTKLNSHKTLENKPFQLLFLSRLHEKKGVELLFEALSKVPFDWSLNIAGGGEIDYLKQLKTHSKNLRIDLKINWLGWVNAQERTSVFETADLLVLPSHNENFANVVIESLATGTPVLVSQYVGLSDYVAEKKLGWVCDTTVESIREKLIESYTQAAQRAHIAAHSSAHIHRDFDPSVLIEKYVKMYQKISLKPSNKKILQTESLAITE
jgi:glycosyltransferase involved in cell wall biosynthesis